jgi:hypothetical protein
VTHHVAAIVPLSSTRLFERTDVIPSLILAGLLILTFSKGFSRSGWSVRGCTPSRAALREVEREARTFDIELTERPSVDSGCDGATRGWARNLRAGNAPVFEDSDERKVGRKRGVRYSQKFGFAKRSIFN